MDATLVSVDKLNNLLTWQHDAACRVIARLKKERDEARGLLAQAERQIPMTASAAATANASMLSNGKRGSDLEFSQYWFYIISMHLTCFLPRDSIRAAAEDDDLGPDGKKFRPGISADTIKELADCNAHLSQQRKRRQVLFCCSDNYSVLWSTWTRQYVIGNRNSRFTVSLHIWLWLVVYLTAAKWQIEIQPYITL